MKKVLAGLVCLGALSGCVTAVGTPPAQHIATGPQSIVGSARHWQVIARDVADRLAPALRGGERLTLAAPAQGSMFTRTFAEMLETELLTDGHAAVTGATRAPVVSFKASVVFHDRERAPHPGSLTLLGGATGAAVWVAERAGRGALEAGSAPFLGLGLGAATEIVGAAMPPAPTAEIVLTATVTRDGVPVSRLTEVYYVADGDAPNYAPLRNAWVTGPR